MKKTTKRWLRREYTAGRIINLVLVRKLYGIDVSVVTGSSVKEGDGVSDINGLFWVVVGNGRPSHSNGDSSSGSRTVLLLVEKKHCPMFR